MKLYIYLYKKVFCYNFWKLDDITSFLLKSMRLRFVAKRRPTNNVQCILYTSDIKENDQISVVFEFDWVDRWSACFESYLLNGNLENILRYAVDQKHHKNTKKININNLIFVLLSSIENDLPENQNKSIITNKKANSWASKLHLKIIKAVWLFCLSFSLFPTALCSQTSDSIPPGTPPNNYVPYTFRDETINLLSASKDLKIFEVKPLDELIHAALRNSPLLIKKDLTIENLWLERKMLKRQFYNYISLGGSFLITSGAVLTSTETPLEEISQLTQQNTIVYNTGFTLRVPIGDFTNRKSKMQMMDNNIKIAQAERIELEMTIRQAVIQYYQKLRLDVDKLKLKSEKLEFQKLNSEINETYFREGSIDVSAYSSEGSKMAQAMEDFITAKNEAILSYLLLREIVGNEIKN